MKKQFIKHRKEERSLSAKHNQNSILDQVDSDFGNSMADHLEFFRQLFAIKYPLFTLLSPRKMDKK